MGPGVGKTYLATGLGRTAVRRRLNIHMARADPLFEKLKAAQLDDTTEVEHRCLAVVSVLSVRVDYPIS